MALPTQDEKHKTGGTPVSYTDDDDLVYFLWMGLRWYAGNGTPNGTVTAPKGSMFVDDDGPDLYQNTDGSTTWEKVGTQS